MPRKHTPGCNCCDPPCPCEGSGSTFDEITFSVGGTHAQGLTESTRKLVNSTDTSSGTLQAISTPSDLNATTCCVSILLLPTGTNGESAAEFLDRINTRDASKYSSVAETAVCSGVTYDTLIHSDFDDYRENYRSIGVKRFIDRLTLTFCPSVSGETLLWTVIAKLEFRVVSRSRTYEAVDSRIECYRINGFKVVGGVCEADTTKYCTDCCGATSIGSDPCIQTQDTFPLDDTPIDSVPNVGAPAAYVDGTGASVISTLRIITRVKTIARTCALPSSITFTNANTTSGTDANIGLAAVSTSTACPLEDAVYTGITSATVVYGAMTEDWTIELG